MLKIKCDSRKVVLGDTFVALRGNNLDGHDFILEAIDRGAKRIVCEHGSYDVSTLVVPDTYNYLETYLVDNYSKYFKDINFIGVTGTNGKTTTCYLVYQILEKLKVNCCYIGTLGCYMKGEVISLDNTTPDILELYNLILLAKEKGCNTVVMEVSSHSLVQERIKGLCFSLCAFTNLTIDHLDYHKSMEEYCNAKLKILEYLKSNGKIIVNVDDSYSKYFIWNNRLSLGISGSDYKIEKYNLSNNGTFISFSVGGMEYSVNTNLIGKFNVYNYLTSLALVNNLGFSVDEIINITDSVYSPLGRAQVIKFNSSLVVIDYAHTPDAVSKIIATFREVTLGKLITIFGCGGDRDKSKRSIMGSIASRDSDYVILTNDNPRTEDEKLIVLDIIKGIENDNYEVIYDRKDAISKGLSLLSCGDCLLILGKGHENYQILGRKRVSLSDYDEVTKYINDNKNVKNID